ncbi:HD domain-containing protein [Rhizobium sp. FY34]|uniref:HD domain-containing protein n=1 Tax=Rhizobium sp. FY34 TaxID=2562309 RepID=UPI0010BFC45F|nr:HD domain-containing protein [Rhizobium sp. FY34]
MPELPTDALAARFAPFEALAAQLIDHATDSDDGAHDLAHILRVFGNAFSIQSSEGGDGEVLAAAVLLHDCVAVEKNAQNRAQASALAADKASRILSELGWAKARIASVAHAIHAHSFSANVAPQTLEAKILQDADRLDSLGLIGVARTFYIAGRMGSQLYHAGDPSGMKRDLDDRTYALDHFQTKLLKLADGFRTPAGRLLAQERHRQLAAFYDAFLYEI